jgi:hypothetical protein
VKTRATAPAASPSDRPGADFIKQFHQEFTDKNKRVDDECTRIVFSFLVLVCKSKNFVPRGQIDIDAQFLGGISSIIAGYKFVRKLFGRNGVLYDRSQAAKDRLPRAGQAGRRRRRRKVRPAASAG